MVPAVTHLMAIAALLSAAAVAIAAGFGGGFERLLACSLAAAAVFLGIVASRLLFLWKSQGKADVSGVLLGMMARIAVPAAAWVAYGYASPTVAFYGFAASMLVLYLIGLFAETTLVVQTIPRYRPRQVRRPTADSPANA